MSAARVEREGVRYVLEGADLQRDDELLHGPMPGGGRGESGPRVGVVSWRMRERG